MAVQVERKRAEEEAQRRAEDLKRDAEREEARRRAEADAQLKVRYYEVILLPRCSPALSPLTRCASAVNHTAPLLDCHYMLRLSCQWQQSDPPHRRGLTLDVQGCAQDGSRPLPAC